MVFTVAVCTWKRSDLLRRTLARLAGVDAAGLDWEVLVVDNADDEATRSVVREAASRLPLRSLVEPRLGASRARNVAIRSARGRWIAWTDDDVLVDRGWLQAYRAAVTRWTDDAFFGGPIRPAFEAPPPTWLTAGWTTLANVYAARDFGNEPRALDPRHVPYGPNLVVRTSVQRRYPFDEALGPRGTDGVRGEETTMVRQLLADGHGGRWVPDARVEHIIPGERMTLEYIARYYVGLGMAERVRRGLADVPGCPPWHWRRAFDLECAYRAARATEPPEVWIPLFVDACVARGRCRTREREKLTDRRSEVHRGICPNP
ncbi:MAG: glycosyltransferase [Vicinamibacterales bacterium]